MSFVVPRHPIGIIGPMCRGAANASAGCVRCIGCCKFQTSRAVPGNRVAWRARASGGPHRNVTHVIRRKAGCMHPRCIAKRYARRRRHPCRNDVRTSHACTRLAGSTVAHAWGFSPRRRMSRAMVRKRCVGETGAGARVAAAAWRRGQALFANARRIVRHAHAHAARRLRMLRLHDGPPSAEGHARRGPQNADTPMNQKPFTHTAAHAANPRLHLAGRGAPRDGSAFASNETCPVPAARTTSGTHRDGYMQLIRGRETA